MHQRERMGPGLSTLEDKSKQPTIWLQVIEQNELIQAQNDDPVISKETQWKEDGCYTHG